MRGGGWRFSYCQKCMMQLVECRALAGRLVVFFCVEQEEFCLRVFRLSAVVRVRLVNLFPFVLVQSDRN